MVKLCLMASPGYPHGNMFNPELGLGRFSKDCQTLWPNHGPKHDLPRVDPFNLRPHQSEEPWKPISGFPEAIQFVDIESAMRKRGHLDMQDPNHISTQFSFGIDERCTRNEKVQQFLMSGSNDMEGGEVGLSMLSIGLQTSTLRNSYQNPSQHRHYGSSTIKGAEVPRPPSIIYPSIELNDQGALLDIIGDLVRRSIITLNPDGKVSFTGTGTELKDMLSVVAEYYLANNPTKWRKQTMLVPNFNSEVTAVIQEPTMLLENVKYAPLKSPEKIKLKPTLKKKTNKKARERDLCQRNYFHACESLLSIIVNKKQNKKATILSVKNSGPELPQLLTQFSASIAGTGIAVLFSVICKVGYSRVPFCSTKLFNTGIGFALVWLSWSVNRLSNTVVHINKNSGKTKFKEEEMTGKLDRCMNDVFFRAAALMAVTVLRLA